jgi:anaerobic magnesium-protoporphyrin IX monomethyl ester cyclase
MRLLLVNVGKKSEIRLPQGLFYLASAVHAAGHEVTIHDESLAANSEQSLERILACDADVIGLSVYTVPWQLSRVEEISRAIKKVRESTLVLWGGWHPTLYPRHTILNENVDVVVRGPGEKPVCELLDALDESRSLKDVTGLLVKEDGEVIETGPECLDPEYLYPRLNLDLVDMETYLRRHDRGAGILQYITSRGCHGRCRFCVMSRLFQGCLIRKPRSQIVSELREAFEKLRITAIHFSDDNTFRNDAEALELCDIVRSVTGGKGIVWRCATRIDTLSGL